MLKLSLSTALASFLAATAALGQTIDDIAQLSILPGWETSDGRHVAAIQLRLAEGWKTYWRAPGDAGIPPFINFEGSDNIARAQLSWPTPEVFDQSGFRSIGYYDVLVIPITLSPDARDTQMHLRGEIEFGVCQDICIPIALPFDAALPSTDRRDPAIVAALINQPIPGATAGLTAAICETAASANGVTLTVSLTLPHTGGQEAVIVEAGDPSIWVSEADSNRDGTSLIASVDMVHTVQDSFALDRSAVRITVLGSERAVDIQGCSAG